jgi:hypothetical protein
MESMTPEEANAWLERFISNEDWPEFSAKAKETTPGQEKQPLSWEEFRAIMVSYCSARQWEIIFDEEDERSLLICAPKDHATDGTEALHGHFPFGEEDALPF